MGQPVNLKLKVTIDLKDLAGLPDAVRKANQAVAQESKRAADRAIADLDRTEKQRIAMQRASIALEERMERQRAAAMEANSRKSLQATQTRAAAAARIERAAAVAEASLVLDKFERRIAIERVKHSQILLDLKGNNAAIEAETRRHQAVVARIRMDQSNFANTPFQQMLSNFNKLNGSLGKILPAVSSAAGSLQGMGGAAGNAGIAMAGLGGALSSLTMGPLGAAVFGITFLSSGINLLIERAERAADLKVQFGADIKDPAKLKEILAAMEKFEATKRQRGSANLDASNAVAKLTGRSGQEMEEAGFSAATLRRQQAALTKSLEYRRIHNEDAKRLDKELLQARTAFLQDETQKALTIEQARYEEQIAKLKDHKENLAKAEQLHAQNVANIRAEAHRADMEFNAKAAADFQSQQIAIENDRIRQIRGAAARERQELLDRDIKRTEQIFTSRGRLGDAEAGDDPLKQLELRQKRELEQYTGNQVALTNLTRAHELERADLTKKMAKESADAVEAESQRKLQAQQALISATGNLLTTVAGKSKAAFFLQKAIALGEIAFNTGKAVTAATAASPLTFGQPWAGYAFGLGAVQAATVGAQAIKGFARGTDFAPGGWAWVGEEGPELMRVPRGAQIKTASESRQMASAPPVTINVHPAPGMPAAEGREFGREAGRGYLEILQRHARLNQDVIEYGVKA